jgi:hypothetical protein
VGTILSWQASPGLLRLFRVVNHREDEGGRYPIVQILEGQHDHIPSLAKVRRLRSLLERDTRKRLTFTLLQDFQTDLRLSIVAVIPKVWTDVVRRLARFHVEPKFERNFLLGQNDLDEILKRHAGSPW